MDDLGMSYLIRGYDAKLLKKLVEDLKFMEFWKVKRPDPTPEELRAIRIKSKWYERRISRVRKVMAAYRVSGSELCDCDY